MFERRLCRYGSIDRMEGVKLDAKNEICVASMENVIAALVVAGFQPGTVALQSVLVIAGTTCSVEVASCTDPKCVVDEGECSFNPSAGRSIFETFCPADPALENLDAALSAANSAAPAMVIISALVGALAIFA